jgi:hypothetical protein
MHTLTLQLSREVQGMLDRAAKPAVIHQEDYALAGRVHSRA